MDATAIIVSIIYALPAYVGAYYAYRSKKVSEKNGEKLAEVHDDVNGKNELRMASKRTEGKIEGILEERDRGEIKAEAVKKKSQLLNTPDERP